MDPSDTMDEALSWLHDMILNESRPGNEVSHPVDLAVLGQGLMLARSLIWVLAKHLAEERGAPAKEVLEGTLTSLSMVATMDTIARRSTDEQQ